MYLRETRQKCADGSLITHLQLAESVWNPHKKRSEVRILHHCGRAEDPHTAERLRNLARSILKKCDPEEIVQHSTQWRLVDAWPYGPLYVLEALWQRLGLADIIADEHPPKPGHFVTSMTCRDALTTLPGHGQRIDLR
jgi:hypothetical protein